MGTDEETKEGHLKWMIINHNDDNFHTHAIFTLSTNY